MSARLDAAPGVTYWPQFFGPAEQTALLQEVLGRVAQAPFYRPTMPGSGKPLSVEMTNFGPLGWITDQAKGYRYEPAHPVTGIPWPEIPDILLALWADTTGYPSPPEACLVNLYRAGTRMGLHRDQDEEPKDAPVLSVSLGDTALFRFGGLSRRDPTRALKLASGDVLMFGGPARLMFHGVDRIQAGSSGLVPGGGRINLTLRRVTAPQKESGRLGG
ncbi:MAG TPA: alpha-ketoglutarate-dependent dioxygenase AlkB [Micropepsaceae bacterium]|nr:alpha-ketoglutarate-dependent dioxygenase AlkB [Micropepsaceae bacterium]